MVTQPNPSKERIRRAIYDHGWTRLDALAKEIGISRKTLERVLAQKEYTIATYLKAIEYCRKISPHEDWNVMTMSEIRAVIFFFTDKLTKDLLEEKVTNEAARATLRGNRRPSLSTYIALSEIAFKLISGGEH